MSCQCVTAKEIMKGLGLNISPDCEKVTCQVNDILRDHYDLLVGSQTTREASGFTGGGLQTINSVNGESILKVHGLYVTTCKCCPTPCMHDVESCDTCCNKRKWVEIKEAIRDLELFEYVVNCNEVQINVGPDVQKGYIAYAKGPKLITSLDDKICLKPGEYRMLKIGFQRARAEMDGDFTAATYFEKKEYNSRQRLLENEDRIPYSIGFGKK